MSNLEEEKVTTIEYYRPKFSRRCFAFILDGMIFLLIVLGLFVASRAIGKTTKTYKENNDLLNSYKLESGIYLTDGDGLVRDIVTYYNEYEESASSITEKALSNGINTFFTYYETELGKEEGKAIRSEYDSLRLDPSLTYTYDSITATLFTLSNGEVVKNDSIENFKIPSKSYIEFYSNYIDNYALGYFSAKLEKVVILEKYFSFVMIVEIIVSILISSILVYYVVPLIFFRGRKTIGKLVYKIGLVDKNILNLSFKLFTLRFLIIFFLEIVLSIFTLGIPLIFSFTMTLVTKKKQTFHDYLLNIQEVDLTDNVIYKNKEEVFAPSSKDDIKNFKLK